MYKIKNSNIPFITVSKENMFTICNSLEYDEIGLIFKAFMDFVYFGIEPTFEKKYMQGIFDGVLQTMERKAEGCFASRENGKKGGRPPKKTNTDIEPNTEFEVEAKISPNKPDLTINDTEVHQEEESLPEAKIGAKTEETITDIDNIEEMGTLIGYAKGFEPAIETRGAVPQMDLNKDRRREEYAANFNKVYNIQATSVSEPTKRIEIEKDRSMEHMMKCLSSFDLNKAKHQISRTKSIDENMKRVEDCLDNLLEGFCKTERCKFYISIIEEVLNSK